MVSKDFYLIYIDEYGNSGPRLDDPQQPIYGLQIAFIKSCNWLALEKELLTIAESIGHILGLGETPRLHMVDLFQRKGLFYKPPRGYRLSVEEAYGWIEQVFNAFKKADVRYWNVYEAKSNYATELREKIEAIPDFATREELRRKTRDYTRLPVHIRKLLFPTALAATEFALRKMDAYGIVFFDQENEKDDSELEAYKIYNAFRKKGIIRQILESPTKKDSRVSVLLATADFSGYVAFADVLKSNLDIPKKPILLEWNEKYVKPYQVIDINDARDNDAYAAYAALMSGMRSAIEAGLAHDYDDSLSVAESVAILYEDIFRGEEYEPF